MPGLNVTFQRPPRALIVGDQTITIEFARALKDDGDTASEEEKSNASSVLSGAQDSNRIQESSAVSRLSPKPGSQASVLVNPVAKVVTPLSQSNAIPVLSSVTHELVKAEDIRLTGPSEEELSDLRQLLANAADQTTELKRTQRQSLDELQEVAVELAAAAASFLVGYSIENDIFAIDDLIMKALDQMNADQPVRVRLNPADHELLKSLLKDPASASALTNVSVIDDDSINRGGCRVESGRRILVSDMYARLEDIRRAWLEKLDESQIERRGDGSAARTLRRFPDRRETA